ncbi:unnamed protein product [Discula destructiva]
MVFSVYQRSVDACHNIFSSLLITALIVGTSALEAGNMARQSDSTTWQKYVRAPSSKTITPVAWLEAYSKGNITNPNGIVGDGVTTLTRKDTDDDMPSIVLDFGQNHVGILSINFAGSETFSGHEQDSNASIAALPGITLAFSESLEYLTNRSDFTRSDNLPDADKFTNGTDQIAVQHHPYNWTDQLGCQHNTSEGERKVCADGLHGFRYLRITLQALPSDAPYTAPFGSVSISSVSLAFSAYLGTPDTFTGWFECSDADITQWWYDAVYTNDLSTDEFRANDTDPRDAAPVGTTLLGKQVLHDGAKRDRDPYVGDLAVSALTLYLSHDNPAAARNVLADLAVHQRADGWIPPASINNYTLALYDYPLWWVVCSSNLVLYTGDLDYLNVYYDVMARTLDTYYPASTNSDGLLQKGLGTSSGYGDYAFLPRSGVITYYNALYVLALERAAQLADIKGEQDDATRWRTRAASVGRKYQSSLVNLICYRLVSLTQQLIAALIRENWDPSVGALYDGGPCTTTTTTTTTTTNDTEKCPVHAQDGNGLAILSGATNSSVARALVSEDTTPDESILAYLTKSLTRPYGNAFYDLSSLEPSSQFDQRMYAFISYFELAARFQTAQATTAANSQARADLAASAFDQLRRTFGHMAAADPFSTFWEGTGPNGSYYQQGYTSLAHGWSTCVVPLMQTYVLGVVPTGPGFAAFDVRPVTVGGGLGFARGAVPTPAGPVGVEWTVRDVRTGSGLRLTVGAPRGLAGTVYVPVMGGDMRVTRGGEVVWEQSGGVLEGVKGVRVEEGYVVMGVEGGSTTVFASGD